MITPLVHDDTWLERLRDVPGWPLPAAHALIVSPHPDDETLGTGGLIWSLRQAGVGVTVLAVTDGEGAYADSPELAETRRGEQAEATRRLGVEADRLVRLGLPDRSLAEHEDAIAVAITKIVYGIDGPVHLFAPWQGDFHPDHEACGRAAAQVAAAEGLALTSYYFWTWHRGTLATVQGLPLQAFALSDEARTAKREALACHRSQLAHESGEPVLPDYLLGPARWPFEVLLDERTGGRESV